MTRNLSPQAHSVLKAAGRVGGLTGTPNTGPANVRQLLQLGAEIDEHGDLVDCEATARARKLRASRAGLAKARKALAAAKTRAK